MSMYNLAVVLQAGGTVGWYASIAASAVVQIFSKEQDEIEGLISPGYQRALLRVTSLIVSFSIFEAYIEDFVKGVTTADWETLDHDRPGLKDLADDASVPEGEKLDDIYRKMKDAAGRSASERRKPQRRPERRSRATKGTSKIYYRLLTSAATRPLRSRGISKGAKD